MKKLIQISKYNENMNFAEEWTEICDCLPPIGTGIILFSEYWKTETAYIAEIINILEKLSIFELKISYVEMIQKNSIAKKFKSVKSVKIDELEYLVRSSLRQEISCRLYYSNILFIDFNYDMYVRIGINHPLSSQFAPVTDLITFIDVSKDLEDEEYYVWGRELK